MLKLPHLNLVEDGREGYAEERELVRRITSTYKGIVRWYTLARFQIIRLRFLEEMAQHLPGSGTILDLGCGFGLFSLYMAARRPRARLLGVDVSERRLELARRAADQLDLDNVRFVRGDLLEWRPDEPLAAAYALDVFHHIPVSCGNELLQAVHEKLAPRGCFLLKDIDTHPRYMMFFTYLLDLIMSPRDVFSYRSASTWLDQLSRVGFTQAHFHYMWDVLPYPHILFVCRKAGEPPA